LPTSISVRWIANRSARAASLSSPAIAVPIARIPTGMANPAAAYATVSQTSVVVADNATNDRPVSAQAAPQSRRRVIRAASHTPRRLPAMLATA